MTYRIIGDSCMDLKPETKQDPHFKLIPLTLELDQDRIIDDETFDQADFLWRVRACDKGPKSACPSPEAFAKAFEGEEDMVFAVTLSQHLSGSHNSALVGKMMYEEDHNDGKKIHVFSSDSACVGETLVALKIQELAEAGHTFEEIVEKTQHFLEHMETFFVLENLDALRKNGRLTGLTAFIATTMNIKPIMKAKSGTIEKFDQARGFDRALRRMCDAVIARAGASEHKILGITHCNAKERAEAALKYIAERIALKGTYLVDAAGVSSLYAGDGGIVICL